MDGIGGLEGWRWMYVEHIFLPSSHSLINIDRFILEGIFTVLVAIAAYWIIPDEPTTAKFLDPDAKNLILAKLQSDRPQNISPTGEGQLANQFKWKFVWAAFKDWQVSERRPP